MARSHARFGAAVNGVSIALAAGLACGLAGTVSGQSSGGFVLAGVARDFKPGHVDFREGASDNLLFSVQNISPSLALGCEPVFVGGGKIVTQQALDKNGRPIQPASSAASPYSSFVISGASVTVDRPVAAKMTVVGAAISDGGVNCKVTTRARYGVNVVQPFGSYDAAIGGNVNDANNPRNKVLDAMLMPGQSLTIDGRSWRLTNTSKPNLEMSWSQLMTVNSANGGVQVKALRNGDSVPNVAGFSGQVSVKAMLTPYLNAAKTKVVLAPNQVIYLFELGTTSTSSSAFDQQDLVVLAEFASDAAYFTTPPSAAPCGAVADVPALLGSDDSGGISSPASFSDWFKTVAGVNESVRHDISMSPIGGGVYAYSTPDFTPVDNKLYGNAGQAHNRGFTYTIDATAKYKQCGGQFLEISGKGEVWVFVNGTLALDMGGNPNGARQVIDFDRLGLVDGKEVRVQLFYAQRTSGATPFSMKTNMVLAAPEYGQPQAAGIYD